MTNKNQITNKGNSLYVRHKKKTTIELAIRKQERKEWKYSGFNDLLITY